MEIMQTNSEPLSQDFNSLLFFINHNIPSFTANQGLVALAFFGVGENLVLFLRRVIGQDNATAASKVSSWTGVVYMCTPVSAFLSDSYWGRYKTCTIFQLILILGLVMLSVSSDVFRNEPLGCGYGKLWFSPSSKIGVTMFYVSMYTIALGYGGNQSTIATFGADQFDDKDPRARASKGTFFSYFYLMLNLRSLFFDTILVYLENSGRWTLRFVISTCSAVVALLSFLVGTMRYRYVTPSWNPLPRLCWTSTGAAEIKFCKLSVEKEPESCDTHKSYLVNLRT